MIAECHRHNAGSVGGRLVFVFVYIFVFVYVFVNIFVFVYVYLGGRSITSNSTWRVGLADWSAYQDRSPPPSPHSSSFVFVYVFVFVFVDLADLYLADWSVYQDRSPPSSHPLLFFSFLCRFSFLFSISYLVNLLQYFWSFIDLANQTTLQSPPYLPFLTL